MEKKLNPREAVAREIMADPSRHRTMSDEDASAALLGLLNHLRERAVGSIEGPDGLDHARQYEVCARTVAYFGTMLIAAEDIDRSEDPPREGAEETN